MNQARELLYAFDQPIEYKDLKFYPIKMKDYLDFIVTSQCLMLEKNSIRDVKVISMSYLEYLFYLNSKDNPLVLMLDGLLRLALNVQDEDFKIRYWIDDNKKPVFFINENKYDSTDFKQIRLLIAEQNMIDLPDETIQKDVRDKMDEARRLRAKIRGEKPPSVEDQMISLGIYSGWTMDYIYNLSIRKFLKSVQRANHIFYQKIYTQASLSGFVEFKNKSVIQSWMAGLGDGNNELIELSTVQNTLNFENAKKK